MAISKTQFPQKQSEGSCTKPDFRGGAVIRKPLLPQTNIAKHLERRRNLQNWSRVQWENVILSDEPPSTLFSTSGRVYMCDSLKKHLIQTVFFRLLNMEEALWWSGCGSYSWKIYLPNGFPSWQDQRSRLFKDFIWSNSSYDCGTVSIGKRDFCMIMD